MLFRGTALAKVGRLMQYSILLSQGGRVGGRSENDDDREILLPPLSSVSPPDQFSAKGKAGLLPSPG